LKSERGEGGVEKVLKDETVNTGDRKESNRKGKGESKNDIDEEGEKNGNMRHLPEHQLGRRARKITTTTGKR